MTGLLNVRHLDETLTRSLRAARRHGGPVSLAYIDIDDFKQLNDRHGHQYGDEVLRTVAFILRQATRGEDSCFRYGGDEFCVILPNCSEAEAGELFVQRLLSELQDGGESENYLTSQAAH